MYKNEVLLVKQRRHLAKAKESYSKEKAAEYYLKNKESIKEKTKNSIQKLATKRKRQDLTLLRMGFLGAELFATHTYPTSMKHDTLIPYLRKIKKNV